MAGNGVYNATFFARSMGNSIPGILLPGEEGTITYHVVPRPQQAVDGNEHILYSAQPFYDDVAGPFDWDGEKPALLLAYPGSEAEFNAVFEEFKTTVGGTNADYMRVLSEGAQLLPQVEGNAWNAAAAMVQAEFSQFAASVTTSISGIVQDPSFDAPFEELTVTAVNKATFETRVTQIWHDGRFVFPSLTAGQYELTISGGALSNVPHFTAAVADGKQTTVDLSLFPSGQIQGTVTTNGAAVLQGAQVRLSSTTLDVSYTAETQADGTFAISGVYPGTYNLDVSLASYVGYSQTVVVNMGEALDENIALVRGATLSGVVTEKDTGNGISGARVWAIDSDTQEILVASTDDEGKYVLPGLAIGHWQVHAAQDDYVDSVSQLLSIPDTQTVPADFAMSKGASISGTITDETNAPLPNCSVVLTSDQFSRLAFTDNLGNYSITGIPTGDFQISLTLKGYASSTTSVLDIGSQEHRIDVDFVLSVGHAISGTVTDTAGRPIAGASVILRNHSDGITTWMTTDDQGRFSSQHVPAAAYTCEIQHDGFVTTLQSVDLTSTDVQNIPITLLQSATITGVVDGSDGVPITSNVVLVVTDVDGNTMGGALVQDDGTYTVAGLPVGTFYLSAFSDKQLFDAIKVTLTEGELSRHDFAAIPGSVHGIVTDAANKPIAGATVTLMSTDPVTGKVRVIAVLTDDAGSYTLAACPGGGFTIDVDKDGYVSVERSVQGVRGDSVILNFTLISTQQGAMTLNSFDIGTALTPRPNSGSSNWDKRHDEQTAYKNSIDAKMNAAKDVYNQYAGKPWTFPDEVPPAPTFPPDFCNNQDLVQEYNKLVHHENFLSAQRAILMGA